ncbi:uncharacterized protein LOC112456404 [Temnothorax curvispinosus]|uniref:Uncharacterized protein LOC112456404 n=1 Tax=Temnothorax curvispinosus TaxID=300111 RepID=A0A6J1PXK3_9HYME|nr:uncharacterized protein LOC112456404 [Temnothorax curvispinosus]
MGATVLPRIPPAHLLARYYADTYEEMCQARERLGFVPPDIRRAIELQGKTTFSNAGKKLIRGVTVGDGDVLISLDVTSLFTNIPKDLVLKAIEERWNYITTKTDLSLPQFLSAVDLILSSTSFMFNGQFYEQIFGSPMGSPLSPILADMVMEDLEKHCIQRLSFRISFFKRYVDDIFAVVPESGIGELLDSFNNYHDRLKFTYEMESNGKLSFLDTTVIREGGSLLTNWFRKPTFSGRYINYFSNHPMKYKINIKIVDKYVNVRLGELRNRNNNDPVSSEVAQDPRRCITVPYIKGLSENVSRTMRDMNFRVLHTIPKRLDCVIRKGKDALPSLSQTELVYKIDCANCDAVLNGVYTFLATSLDHHVCGRCSIKQKSNTSQRV